MVRPRTGERATLPAPGHVRWYRRTRVRTWVVILAAAVLVPSIGAAAIPATPAGSRPTGRQITTIETSGDLDLPLRWGAPERVAPKRSSEDYSRARIAVRGGQVLAVWDAPVKGHPGVIQIRVSSRGNHGVWTASQRVARFHAGFISFYEVALGPGGTAIVVWSYGDRTSRVMETHREGGAWSTPARLGGDTAEIPRAVIDDNGDMTVAWTSHANGTRVDVASRVAGGSWGEVQHLGRFAGDPSIAANSRGDVAVAWGTGSGVSVAVRRHGQDWAKSHNLASVIAFPDDPQVAIGPAGRVLVMWSRSTEEEERFTRRHLAWARTRADGTWTGVRYLDTRRRIVYGSEPSLSLDRRGHALAVWWTDTGQRHDMRASRFRFGHGWSRPQDLGRSCCRPVALMTPSQTAVALLDQTRLGSRTLWAYQRPGQAWKTRTVPVQFVTDADGYGRRMAMLYYGPHLTARMLTVGAPAQ